MKRIIVMIALLLTLCMILLCMPVMAEATDVVRIALSDDGVTVNGEAATGDTGAAVYVANDIVYYQAGQDFTYGEGTEADAHEQSEADTHTVVHIAQPGTYEISGSLTAGQIAVDLGEDADEDPTAVVTLVLNGVDITCSVAPAIIFYNVYECGDDDEDSAVMNVDTAAAGANIVIGDGSVNNVNGSYVARIYEPGSVELNEDHTEVTDAKKLHKYDGALYSKMSMNISGGAAGDGVLKITAENEGLCSDLHLNIDGGIIDIVSGNDGINTSEDNVSVCAVNGGVLNICVSGETGEGDGIDSNGWLVINGGTITSAAFGQSADAGIDSDKGIYINGGNISASGNMLDEIAGGDATYAVFAFASSQSGGSQYALKDADGATVAQWTPANDFSYLVVSDPAIVPGTYTLWCGDTQLQGSKSSAMTGGNRAPRNFEAPEMPEDGQTPDGFETPEGEGMPDGFEMPGGGEMPEGAEMPDGFGKPGEFDGSAGKQMAFPQQDGFGGGPGGRFGGRGGFGGMGQGGETSVEFVIAEGGNTFASVAAVTAK